MMIVKKDRAAEAAGDPASLDLATRRIAVHEKTAWMLRATATGGGAS